MRAEWSHQGIWISARNLCDQTACPSSVFPSYTICVSWKDVFISHMGELIPSLEGFRGCQAHAWHAAEICYCSSVAESCWPSGSPNIFYPLTGTPIKCLINSSISPGPMEGHVLITRGCVLLCLLPSKSPLSFHPCSLSSNNPHYGSC